MREKVLVVDDEKRILEGIRRHLRKEFHIETALGSEEGMTAVKTRGPYAVVVSDLRMPGMDGIQFLSKVKAFNPDTVRMMLSGNADLENAMEAVNEGNIFRFFTKPCPIEILTKGIVLGIEQYHLVTAEKELLQKTLKGSIKVLTEVLSLVNPEAFGRSSRIKHRVKQLASHLDVEEILPFELAAMLSQLGCVTLPEDALKRLYRGDELTEEESHLYDTHPLVASNLLSNIPRMDTVAEIIRYQDKHFDGSGSPEDNRREENIPFGARILKVALDYDLLEEKGIPKQSALNQLKDRTGWYDPVVLDALEAILNKGSFYLKKNIRISELLADMILDEDIFTQKGRLLICKGQEISPILLNRLKNFAKTTGVREPIRVSIPIDSSTDDLEANIPAKGEMYAA